MPAFPVPSPGFRGRGADGNPPNRFEALRWEPDPDADPADLPSPRTLFLNDDSRSFLTTNDSPDLPFTASCNPYRGCEHGCAYCYARPTHEYLGFSAGLDFESRILVKLRAPELLRAELARPSWKPQAVAMSGVTDCYQPAERKFRLTRACLEVFLDFRNPVGIVTKNHMVTRDADVLGELARWGCAKVFVSITTLDGELARALEPRTASPRHRLAALAALRAAGVPCGVMVAPVIPGLNDHEIPAILKEAGAAGAIEAGYVLLRLPHGVKDVFSGWLQRNRPGEREKILGRIRELRGGELNDSRFGARMTGIGAGAETLARLFAVGCRRAGFTGERTRLTTDHFRRVERGQAELF